MKAVVIRRGSLIYSQCPPEYLFQVIDPVINLIMENWCPWRKNVSRPTISENPGFLPSAGETIAFISCLLAWIQVLTCG
jgi:hypothetical protein